MDTEQNAKVNVNAFMQKLTRNHKDLLSERGQLIATGAEREQKTLISNLEGKRDAVKDQLIQLSDISPRETTSLTFINNFNASEWVKKTHELELQLLDIEVELGVAIATYDKWFK